MYDETRFSPIGGQIALLVIPSIAVVGRFWSRLLTSHLGADDWTCLLALVFNIVLDAMSIAFTYFGLGKHINKVPADQLEVGLTIFFSAYFVFDIGLGIMKQSALLFYRRVFGLYSRKFRIALLIGHALVAVWYILTFVISLIQCLPPEKNWRPTVPGKCINLYPIWLVSGLWDTIVDLYILILPAPIIWKLQMKRKRKILVTLALVLGYCVITSLGRVTSTLMMGSAMNEDITGNGNTVLIWTILEIGLGIVSTCIPSWWVLFTHLHKHGFRSLFTKHKSDDLRPSDPQL